MIWAILSCARIKLRAAADQYSEAVRFRPDYLEANFNLALALAPAGQSAEAISNTIARSCA